MNFNLDLKVDKAMNKLSESETLRRWTYNIGFMILAGLAIWRSAPILNALAKIIELIIK